MAGPGKQRKSVKARSILCSLAVNGLGMPLTDLADRLGISLPTVSVAVQRGGEIVDREKLGIAQLRI
jgi:DNA-binding Lrp family transcriptional regulator